jgi:hypothetical protein
MRGIQTVDFTLLTPTLSATAPALPSYIDVVNVENAGAFFHLLPTSM